MQTLDINGAQVGYVETGSGESPIVFVHGWSCDDTFFAPQADHFSTTHRCVSVDLRGHRGLDAPTGSATIPTHAADVVGLCEALGIERPVIAGHSMGGSIALEMAAQDPVLPAALVLVDPAYPIPSQAIAQLEAFVEALESPDYQRAARGFIEKGMFMRSDDEVVKRQVIEAMLNTDQDVMVSEMKSVAEWGDSRQSHAWTLPVINIPAGRPVGDPESLGQRCTNLQTVHTPGVGHFNQLLAPDAVNEAIETFLAQL